MDEATRAQVRAARPDASTWVAANAGSGKTRVLTDRVARLLLRGTDPRRILCLTYTKAAAAEMQNRLFDRLGEWAMLDDVDLRDRMAALGESETVIPAAGLARARTLFARALETPGGLKIQTIHGFCDGLLRRFPLEAGVNPQFTVMETRQAHALRAQVFETVAGDPKAAFPALAARISSAEFDLDKVLTGFAAHRDRLARMPDTDRLWQALGMHPTPPPGPMEGVDPAALKTTMAAMAQVGGKTEQKFLAALNALLAGADGATHLATRSLLTTDGSLRKSAMVVKATEAAVPGSADLLRGLSERLKDLRDHGLAADVVAGARDLARFAGCWLVAYEAEKQALGLLDFDDLIERTRDLLTRAEASDWVRYKLDGGIDHLLVDEAQDTSPAQWAVIDALAAEFHAGDSAAPRARSLFVVGDEKQSIYSFQGADPAGFGAQRTHYSGALADVGEALEVCDLAYSFRSAGRVLAVVDQVFTARSAAEGGTGAAHLAFHADMPGRVEHWPLVTPGEDADQGVWYDPVDAQTASDPGIELAAQITARIADLLARGAVLPGTDRPVTAGDFLILVRSRGRFFKALLKALKAGGVPVAGADRLKLGAQLAVRDVLALLQVIATPQDDLALAAALRSPLFGLDEAALFALAHKRPRTLLGQVLDDPAHEAAAAILTDLRAQADFLRPFELIDRLLTRHGARAQLRDRLGVEAEEAVDALANLALDYEQTEPPSLTGFLEWMTSTDAEVKRQLDADGGEVRVMTVHGAKGLEAPIVILPDSLPSEGNQGTERIMELGADMAVLRPAKDDMPPGLRVLAETARARDAEENWRLLYVAMTRAERWLIVCGAGKPLKTGAPPEGWYTAIGDALEAMGATGSAQTGWIWSDPWDLAGGAAKAQTAPVRPPAAVRPDWIDEPAPYPTPGPAPLAPSRDGAGVATGAAGADFTPAAGLDRDAAALRGRRLHLLLEHLPGLPPKDRAARAVALLSQGADAAPRDEILDLAAQAGAVIDAPDLAWIFHPGDGVAAWTELPLAGRLDALSGRALRGQIDRLLITPEEIWAIDFKTAQTPPAPGAPLPGSVRGQMALYHAALAQIFPGRVLRMAVLWTDAPRLSVLDAADLALATGTSP